MAPDISGRMAAGRARLGLSQREAAEVAGLSQTTWQRIETDGKAPTISQLAAIAGALGRTIASFTDENPVRDRLIIATRTATRHPTPQQQRELAEAMEHLMFLMEVDAHLRDIGVGVHG